MDAAVAGLSSNGTFIITATGMTASVTGIAEWMKRGSNVSLLIPLLLGTSNATTFTLTGLPVQIVPTRKSHHVVLVHDNGSNAIGFLLCNAGSSVLTLFPSATGTNWTASGAKGIGEHFIHYTMF